MSWNIPSLLVVPRYSSRMAYPTQFRGSEVPCVSQVLEDSVIQMRSQRTGMGVGVSRITSALPVPLLTLPCGNVSHAPRVAAWMGSSPVQYWTRNLVAYGLAQAMRMLSTGCGVERSINTHCGCNESFSA